MNLLYLYISEKSPVRTGDIFRSLALFSLTAIRTATRAAPHIAASALGFPLTKPEDQGVTVEPLPLGRVVELTRWRPVLIPVAHSASHRGRIHAASHAPCCRRCVCLPPPTYTGTKSPLWQRQPDKSSYTSITVSGVDTTYSINQSIKLETTQISTRNFTNASTRKILFLSKLGGALLFIS